MKITKTKLVEMVKKAVVQQLNENPVGNRVMRLERFMTENGLSAYEMLEDVLEQLDDESWSMVLRGLKDKYGYSS